MEETLKKHEFNLFYYVFKIVISALGAFLGIVFALTFFYPLIISFSNDFIVVFFELYFVIFAGLAFFHLFATCFDNYVNYKPLFYKITSKDFFVQKNFLLSFYIFGLILFFFFIRSLF